MGAVRPKGVFVKFFLALAFVTATATAVRADPPKDTPKDAPKDTAGEVSKENVDKFLAFFDKLVDLVVADKSDCTKMAGDIGKHIDGNAELIKRGQEAQAKGQKLPKQAQDHMMGSMKKMAGALQEKCMQDKGVQTAMERLKMH
jgi:hypothetical protein